MVIEFLWLEVLENEINKLNYTNKKYAEYLITTRFRIWLFY